MVNKKWREVREGREREGKKGKMEELSMSRQGDPELTFSFGTCNVKNQNKKETGR